MFINVSNCNLGDTVLIRKYGGLLYKSESNNFISDEIEADVIGKFSSGETCLGWKDCESLGLHSSAGSNVESNRTGYWKSDSRYVMVDNLSDYNYYAWINPTVKIRLKMVIVSANRKCVGCDRPAPHAVANLPDDKFQCISCKALEMLG